MSGCLTVACRGSPEPRDFFEIYLA
jgi:hypothetical protein